MPTNEARLAASQFDAGFALFALQSPSFPPSSAGSRREKARMLEHMDVRGRPLRGYAFALLGRAGRRIPSNAGARRKQAKHCFAPTSARTRMSGQVGAPGTAACRFVQRSPIAGNPGGPSLWLLSLGQARESDSLPEGQRKLLMLILTLILILILKRKTNRPAPADQDPPYTSQHLPPGTSQPSRRPPKPRPTTPPSSASPPAPKQNASQSAPHASASP